ncbi:uncharacterized protein [Physcomitrium patens]|uniref:Uncharacterized protein n=1 Tax=Physcomitrium patens TaxID=3218 RepID=A0A2K1KBU9_PHYPA|nr:actin cytoskeleton-regulatory complex protein PAN1-like isoform X1 [Physcomitrium patens]PNR51249.1 hypothetical protein PHYPA_010435 [Physcomitrium patens]|eukprot:XP_024380036.1 actin cytoskeleton-regulatory complex protein PAN1-like isoform X1 [Physcomitrella patens]
MANAAVFDSFFRMADLDRDGRISGSEAVGFFQGSGLPQATLAKVWQFSDRSHTGFLSRHEFNNALKLVTIAQTGRDLTPELVNGALNGPTSSHIPPPRINTPTPPSPPARAPSVASQGSYAQQFPAQNDQAYQLSTWGGYSDTPQFASLRGGVPAMSKPQGCYSSVGNISQGTPSLPQQSRPSFPSTGQGMTETRPTLGGLMGTYSHLSGAQFSSVIGSAGSGLQSAADSRFPGPNTSSALLSTGGSLPSSTSLSAFQAGGAGGLKTGPESTSIGDLYGTPASTSLAAGSYSIKAKSTSEAQGFGVTSRRSSVDPVALAPTTLSSSTSLVANSTRFSQTPLMGPVYGTRPLNEPAVTPPWPRMNQSDVQRYTRVFSKVDTDRDGKITGEQARALFLSWQQPRNILKQVWSLSDQDGDSMMSVREFCTALYLMERFREGRSLPSKLPPGIHLDDPPTLDEQMSSTPRPGYSCANWQNRENTPQVGPGYTPAPKRATLLTTREAQTRLQNLTPSGGTNVDSLMDSFWKFNDSNGKRQPAKEAPSAIRRGLEISQNEVRVETKLMEPRQKAAYYRTKLQEVVLFKTKCDNKITETTERTAAGKREVESLAKKYDEKFKAAAELNAQLAVQNSALRETQEKKLELLDALFKMDNGGDPNALLQKRADHLATDLDKLKIALRGRCQRLGVKVRESIPMEMPFGWTQNLQEKAAEWSEWGELEDPEFSVVKNLTNEVPSVEKPCAAASWGNKPEKSVENDYYHVPNNNNSAGKETALPPESAKDMLSPLRNETPARKVVSFSDDVLLFKPSSDLEIRRNRPTFSVSTTNPSERSANATEEQEFESSVSNGSPASSPPTSSPGTERGSIAPDAFSGIGSSWGFAWNDNDVDSGPRTSWNVQSKPFSTQEPLEVANQRGLIRFSGSRSSVVPDDDSFDLDSPRALTVGRSSSPAQPHERNVTNLSRSIDSFMTVAPLAIKDSNKKLSPSGGDPSPKAAPTPSPVSPSPKANSTPTLVSASSKAAPTPSSVSANPKPAPTPTQVGANPKASKRNSGFFRFFGTNQSRNRKQRSS